MSDERTTALKKINQYLHEARAALEMANRPEDGLMGEVFHIHVNQALHEVDLLIGDVNYAISNPDDGGAV